MSLVFEWDEAKAESNLKKHRLRFDDIIHVFADPLARIFVDESHSEGERREIIIGHLPDRRLVLAVFYEVATDRIRIISARPATAREQRDYEENSN